MGKLATLTPNRMDVRLGGEGKWVNLQFHKDDDHIDVIFNRHQIPILIEQLQTLLADTAETK